MTRQRLIICEIVKNSSSHLSAAQIKEIAEERLGRIALATVYNNLNALVSEGIIGKYYDGRSELFDKYPYSHAHLQCPKCNSVKDLPIPAFTDFLYEKTSVDSEDYILTVKCLCDACKDKNKKNKR